MLNNRNDSTIVRKLDGLIITSIGVKMIQYSIFQIKLSIDAEQTCRFASKTSVVHNVTFEIAKTKSMWRTD